MSKYVGFAAMLLVCCCVIPAQSTICWVEPSDDFHDRMPLILKSSADEFVYPSKCGSKSLRLTFIDNLRAACPGDSITVLGRNTNLAVSQLSCYGITLFGLSDTSYAAPFRKIRCNRVPESEVQTTTGACGNGTISRIGFAISSSSFVPSIEEVCSDANQTYWTHHKVVPNLTKRSKLPILGGGDNSEEGFFDGWGSWFKPTTTTTTTTSAPTTEQIINTLLVPREDMFYRAQQDSTFNSLNNVPMYRSVRNGNWRLVEEIVRKLASAKKQCTTLDVWTGRYNGTTSMASTEAPTSSTTADPTTPTTADPTTPTTTAPTTSSTTAPTTPTTTAPTTSSTTAPTTPTTTAPTTPTTTMGTDTRLKRQIQPSATSLPRFVFKMVVDKQHSRGIVFVTLNDPTVTAITASEQLCTPYAQCSSSYPQFNVAAQGYTHCCTLADFAAVATELGMPTFTNYQPII